MLLCLSASADDGDTLRCGKERVRLVGVDAPERGEPGHAAATSALARMLRGRRVVCHALYHDRYRRIVAACTADSIEVGCDLLRSGFVRAVPRYGDCRGRYGVRP
jgi:endonuclease YncB( thermonuclease family)